MGNESKIIQTDEKSPEENVNLVTAAKMKKKIRGVQFTKQMVDEEVRLLGHDMDVLSDYLKAYCHIKYDFLNGMHARHLKARKVVSRSMAFAATSLAFGLRCNQIAVMKDALPWTLGVGAISLGFTLIYLKDFLHSFRKPDSKWKEIEAIVSDVPRPPPEADDKTIEPMNLSLNKSVPEELFALCFNSNELAERKRRRLTSYSL